jgi:hypothetical protein
VVPSNDELDTGVGSEIVAWCSNVGKSRSGVGAEKVFCQ